MKNFIKSFGFILPIVFAAALCIIFGWNLFLALGAIVLASLMLPNLTGTTNTVVSNPLIGKSRKSMGNATFSSWKGINVLKDKATSVANPRSGSQLMHRSAFSKTVELFRQAPAAIRAGYKKLAVKKSEFNAFASDALKNAFDYSAPPDAPIDATLLLISKGTIASTPILTEVADRSANTITATFAVTADQPGQSIDDIAILAAYNTVTQTFTGAVAAGTRGTGTANIDLPGAWNTGDTLVMFLGFYNPLSGESSDSQNLTAAIVA